MLPSYFCTPPPATYACPKKLQYFLQLYYSRGVIAFSREGCDGTHVLIVVGAAGVRPAAHGLHARSLAGLCDLP